MNDNTFGYYYSQDYVDDPFIPTGENLVLEKGIHTIHLASPRNTTEYLVVEGHGNGGYTIIEHHIIDNRHKKQ